MKQVGALKGDLCFSHIIVDFEIFKTVRELL
jgi:hypothetical protein